MTSVEKSEKITSSVLYKILRLIHAEVKFTDAMTKKKKKKKKALVK